MMRFDSSEIGQTMSEIVAYGTAVILELRLRRCVQRVQRRQGNDDRASGRRRSNSHFRRFQSRRISRAALWPGMPDTPPPGCVEEPHWKSPAIGVR
jgi:hypothetical protein